MNFFVRHTGDNAMASYKSANTCCGVWLAFGVSVKQIFIGDCFAVSVPVSFYQTPYKWRGVDDSVFISLCRSENYFPFFGVAIGNENLAWLGNTQPLVYYEREKWFLFWMG